MSTDPFAHLGEGGRRLVDDLLAELAEDGLEPDAREVALLVAAGELRDRMDRLEAMIAADGERRVTSTGTVQLHPAVAELRQHAVALSRVLAGVSMVDTGAGKSARHQRAALMRWARVRKAEDGEATAL